MEFCETDSSFYLFGYLHVRHAAVIVGVFGIISTVLLTIAGAVFFQWNFYDTSVDVIAVLGFAIFFISGIIIHYWVIVAVQKTKARYLNFFSGYHIFLIALDTITALIAVGELVSDQTPNQEATNVYARYTLLVLPCASITQIMMILIIVKTKMYLKKRARWLRLSRFPGIRQVMETPIHFHNKVSASTTSTEPDGQTADREETGMEQEQEPGPSGK